MSEPDESTVRPRIQRARDNSDHSFQRNDTPATDEMSGARMSRWREHLAESDGSSSSDDDEIYEKKPPQDEGPPDGGLQAWLVVAGSFTLFFNGWGVVNSFGVWQQYYTELLACEATGFTIAWIGSLQAFLLVSVGAITGPLFDMGYLRPLIWVGSFMIVFGMMMTSLATKYWQIMLAQGVCMGLGAGCIFVPSASVLPTYFNKKKALVQGIAASGSSLGGVIYPIVFHRLQPTLGFPWATRIVAFIMLGTLSVPCVVMRSRLPPAPARKLFDAKAWKEPPFTLFSVGIFFGFAGMYIPFSFLSQYAVEDGIADQELAFWMLPIINSASIFGRIIPNFFADYVGNLNMLIPTSGVAGLLCFCWLGIHNLPGVIVFAILYGFFSGTFVSLPPTVVATLSPTMGEVGVRIGMSFFLASLGLLVGNPVAAKIIEQSLPGMQGWAGACIVMTLICMSAARYFLVGFNFTKKV